MTWENLIEWVKNRSFCKGNYQYPAYVYDYPDFLAVGDYACFRDGDIVKNGRTILRNQTPDDIRRILAKNYEE